MHFLNLQLFYHPKEHFYDSITVAPYEFQQLLCNGICKLTDLLEAAFQDINT